MLVIESLIEHPIIDQLGQVLLETRGDVAQRSLHRINAHPTLILACFDCFEDLKYFFKHVPARKVSWKPTFFFWPVSPVLFSFDC